MTRTTCKRGHAKQGRRCTICHAANERRRYWANPDRERERKRTAYHSAPALHLHRTHIIDDGERMTQTATAACTHASAVQLEEFPGIFYCTDEDIFFDVDSETVPNPYEAAAGAPHSGKAPAPAATGATQSRDASAALAPKSRQQTPLPPGYKRPYKRDESLMVQIKCSHPGCEAMFPMWPQNVKAEGNYCPDLHRPQIRLLQNAQRQKRHRERNRR